MPLQLATLFGSTEFIKDWLLQSRSSRPLLNTSTVYHWRVDSLGPDGLTQGDNWAFITAPTVYPPTPPPKATTPSPSNGETGVSAALVILSWTSGGDTLSYNVYLNGVFQGNQSGTTFSAGALSYSTAYTWRIDPVNAVGTTTGDTWQFTTGVNPVPSKANTPTPSNGATAQDPVGMTLSWVNGGGATSYDVYINGVFQVNQAGTSYNAGNVTSFDTITWRIDSVNGSGTTTGDTWSFDTTGHATVIAWAAQVVTNGGAAPSVATKRALHVFCAGLDTDSLTASMVAINCFVPDNLIAGITPLIKGPGLTPWTNNNYVGADLTVNGLIGNGSSKYLNTGVVPDTAFGASYASCGLSIYISAADDAVTSEFGCNTGVAFDKRNLNINTSNAGSTTYDGPYNAGPGRITAANSAWAGYLSANRTSNVLATLYKANSETAHVSIGTSASDVSACTQATHALVCGALNYDGTVINFTTKRISFAAVHAGLSAVQSASFFTRIQALRIALGGGYLLPIPTKATTPSPANAAVNQQTSQTLTWANGGNATSYDVYVNGVFKGNQAGTSYATGDLGLNSSVTWRIDAKNGSGTTTGIPGPSTPTCIPRCPLGRVGL